MTSVLDEKFRCVMVGRHVHYLVKDITDTDPTPCHHFTRLPLHAVVFFGDVLDVDCQDCMMWLTNQRQTHKVASGGVSET